MNLPSLKPVCLALLLGLFGIATHTQAQTAAAPPVANPVPKVEATPGALKQAEELHRKVVLPGLSLAEGLSQITGVAVSPLLGVSAVGAWKYFRTEEHLRALLPWYCHPLAWGPGLALICVCFLKDFLGAAAPALVKKPLDFLELFEDKLSALVASAAFVPAVALAISHFQQLDAATQASHGLEGSGLAMLPMAAVMDYALAHPWITVPVGILCFLVVWLSSHAINVLIALSPFGMVDAGLKLTKLALITLVTGSALIHPYLGAAVSLVLIAIGALLAGWSLRLTIFGTLMGSDFLLNKRAAAQEAREGPVKGFLARRNQGVPVRTYGRLEADAEGRPIFTYRPWLVLPRRALTVENEGLVLCKGLIHPSVSHRPVNTDERLRSTLILLPRYRRVEESIAARFGCQDVVDSALLRGFKAVRQWLVDVLSSGRRAIDARAA